MNLNLSFNDHTIQVISEEGALLKKIAEEFHFFVTANDLPSDTLLNLYSASSPEIPSIVATKILENCVVYSLGNLKYVDYFGEALTVQDELLAKTDIYSENPDRLYELAFLTIHSLLGQHLDSQGLCRIHALAVSYQNKNAIIMLPSKGGKSTLLCELLKNPEIKIISDDMPLVDIKGHIHPFPSKISLQVPPESGVLASLEWREFKRAHYPPKWTASLGQLNNRIDRYSHKNKNILIAGYRISQGKSFILKVSAFKMFSPLFEHMIMGMGLPQILEIFLNFRASDAIKLLRHALMRSICAFQLARKSENYSFYMGPSINLNAQIIMDILNDQTIT